ncbi:unnamed protein product [Durusdinium trenchii]|uniref:Uncharacterized protein n=2 Tax=Durusdinium trenchii TaxID=1381693 RepID=A0ABP0NSN8_9DINO
MDDARVAEIEKHFVRGSTHHRTWRNGDWVIVSEVHGPGEDDHFSYGLFHVPTWQGGPALLTAHWTDLSHVGCKGPGQALRFGDNDTVLKVDGNDWNDVLETTKLESLNPTARAGCSGCVLS